MTIIRYICYFGIWLGVAVIIAAACAFLRTDMGAPKTFTGPASAVLGAIWGFTWMNYVFDRERRA